MCGVNALEGGGGGSQYSEKGEGCMTPPSSYGGAAPGEEYKILTVNPTPHALTRRQFKYVKHA